MTTVGEDFPDLDVVVLLGHVTTTTDAPVPFWSLNILQSAISGGITGKFSSVALGVHAARANTLARAKRRFFMVKLDCTC